MNEEKIIENILNVFTSRRGLKQEWEQIDDDLKKEVRKEILTAIKSELPDPLFSEYYNCPACPNQGWYTEGSINQSTGEVEPEQVQCEFCYTHPQSVFNYLSKIKVVNYDAEK